MRSLEITDFVGSASALKDEISPNVVDIAAGEFVAALDVDGKVRVWTDDKSLNIQAPPILGRAVAIRAEGHIIAAQMEDGSWRAWGSYDHNDIIGQINKLGPAIDILLYGNGNTKAVMWIEPASMVF